MNFLTLIDYIGTFAFAISGIRLASAKRFDWFGAYVVGFVTAVGGGTIRDLLLDVTPFWMLQSSYLIVTALALGFVILFGRYVIRLNNTFFIFINIVFSFFCIGYYLIINICYSSTNSLFSIFLTSNKPILYIKLLE